MPWYNKAVYEGSEGLAYESALVEDLIRRDTDGDGVLDWEESLLGLDPTKAETTPGTPDMTAASKLRSENSLAGPEGSPLGSYEENLTETDKFSQELFSTVAALEQSGALDQATAEKMVSSLAEQIQNSPPRKVFFISDIKTTKEESAQAIEKYLTDFERIQAKYPIQNTVLDVLQKFIVDENTTDPSALEELSPIVSQMNKVIGDMANMTVPQFLASFHLDYINALEMLIENISDMQFYETDTLVSLGAITQYEKSSILLESAGNNLIAAIAKKLNL
ncbi:MAG: hypothetical protein M3M85_01725 [bacterium]|nr:hypothetical protein [bacterium]